MQRSRPSGRVGRIALALGFVLLAGSFAVPGASATQDPGFGQAQAQLFMLDPRTAELSFGVRFGPTVADHRHVVARAEAQSTDYGLIGGALTGAGCSGTPPALRPDQLPQKMLADSRTAGDANEQTVTEGPITQSVLARNDPYAKATSRLAEVDVPALFSLDGATDQTTSGVDAHGRPTVTAEVNVAKLTLLGGLVQLDGLRWHAEHVAGHDATGSFTIGSGSIGGTPIPTKDASAAVQSVNNALHSLGLVLAPPRSHRESDTFFVDPLEIGIAQNPTRDAVTEVGLEALQPVREQLFGALIAANCNFESAITVTDILLGAGSGGGSLTIDLGGAQAQLLPPDDATTTTTAVPTVDETPPASPAVGTGAALPVLGSPAPPAPSGPTTLRATRTNTHLGSASDGALAVGLVTVGLGALLVEGDRRKMRRAGAEEVTAS